MRDQYDRIAMERELQEEEEKKQWLREVTKLYEMKFKEIIGFDRTFTSKDFYDNRGLSPREFLKELTTRISLEEDELMR